MLSQPVRRRAVRSLLALGAIVPAAVIVSSAGATSPSANRVSFATPVVVNEFTPGYEPDLAIDGSRGPYRGSAYVSMPEGFTTTESFIWRSDDHFRTFHPIEGQAGNKTATCAGGGDTELQVDPVNGHVFFSDLQGLTNFSNSMSADGGHTWVTNCAAVPGAGVDRQWLAIDDNGGTAAVGSGANDGRLYFDYDNIERSGTGQVGGYNQLVMNESLDGVHFGASCVGANLPAATPLGNAVAACPAPPAIISPNEEIPGNVVVDNGRGHRFQHRVYAIHTGDRGSSVVMSWCQGAAGDHTAAQVAAHCTDPTLNPNGANPYWHDAYVRAKGAWETGKLFPSVAIDTAGNLYAAWAEYPGAGDPVGPGAIKLSKSTDGGAHWSAPARVSPPDQVNTVMPWIVAGDAGRVGIAWYGSRTHEKKFGPDPADHSQWSLYYAFSTNALASKAAYTTTMVTEPGHYIKYGDISTGGFGGSQDRSLGDFFEVRMGPQGQAVIVYVDETSNDREQDTCGGCGQTPPQAAGPIMVVTQNGGPGLLAHTRVPAIPNVVGSVSDPTAPAFLAQAGQDVAAPAALKVIGASVAKQDATHLRITLRTADPQLANDLRTLPPLGGPVNTWLVRWAAPNYRGPGDGNIFFVGMESDAGAAPTFYTGSTQHIDNPPYDYELVYQPEKTIPGVIQGSTITWTVPLSAIGSPRRGDGLFSITGFTATQQTPNPPSTTSVPNQGMEVGNANLPNQIGSTPAFDYWLK